MSAQLVPELYCSNFELSLAFYTKILGFEISFSRPEDRFAYLRLGKAELMIEQTMDPSRTLVAGPLEPPLGRGVNLQIFVEDVDRIHESVRSSNANIFLPIEERWYRKGNQEVGNRQFVVMDPDGYLLRFAQDLGNRPTSN